MTFRQWLANLLSPLPQECAGQQEVLPNELRSPKWPDVRKEWLRSHPACAACGNANRAFLQVHHILPVHAIGGLERELDTGNLITLCCNGPGHINCHLTFGHCGRWRDWNLTTWSDAQRFCRMLNLRIRG